MNIQTIYNYYDRLNYNVMRVVPNLSLNFNPKLRIICVEITNHCNMACQMCNLRNTERKFGYMNLNLFKEIVKQSASLKPTTFHLNFEGESFMHPQIKQFLELSAATNSKHRQLFTNGMLVKPHLETIARCLTMIVFSLDGVDEANDRIRLGCKYDVVMENIEALKEVRDQLGTDLKIGVNLTNYTQTEKEIQDFIAEMQSHFVDIISISEYRDEMNHYIKPGYDRRSVEKRNSKRIAIPIRYCPFPLNTIVVLWNGDISFCLCAVTTHPPTLTQFNAYNDSLKDIWNSQTWREMRNDSFRLGYPPFKVCTECQFAKELR